MLRTLLNTVVLLLAITPAWAAENPLALLPGTYTGEVFNGSDMDPVVTTFVLQPSGRLTGSYEVDEENGAYSGTLSNILFEDARTISMEWTDKFGEGLAVMEFSGDFSSFVGEWTNKDGENPLPWRGHK
jgi:hypothetical protein